MSTTTFNPALLQSKKDDVVVVTGIVKKPLRGAMFEVQLDEQYVVNKKDPKAGRIIANICGKIKKNFINIVIGDAVIVELSVYDMTKGRITYRESGKRGGGAHAQPNKATTEEA